MTRKSLNMLVFKRFQVLLGKRCEFMDLGDNIAGIQLIAIGAGFVSFGDHADPDLAFCTM